MGNGSVQWQAGANVLPGLGSGMSWESFLLLPDAGVAPLPPWWSRARDRYFRDYLIFNQIFGAISYGRVTKIKNMTWRIVADDDAAEPLLPEYHALFENSQFSEGFRTFLSLFANDLYNQDNGGFIELIGPGLETRQVLPTDNGEAQAFIAKGPLDKAKIESFAHLDAAQCWRTYNKEWPVIYTNPWDYTKHILHHSRVVARSQFRQPQEKARGIGLSAPSRAFMSLELLRVTNEYTYEKIVGASPELAIARGISERAIRRAFQDGELQADADGLIRYRGTVFLNADNVPGEDSGIDIVGLRSVPDGWDKEKEITLAIYIVAMAYGTHARDLGWPASVTGATKADAEIQDLQTMGSGRADILSDIEEIMTRRVLPDGLRFEFDAKDDLEDKRRAEVQMLRAQTRQIQLLSGELSIDEARQLAARDGDIDPIFIEESTTTGSEGESIKATARYAKMRQQFGARLFSAMNKMRAGKGGAGQFIHEASDLLQSYGQRAFLTGVQDAGGAGVNTAAKLTQDERETMQILINDQVGFLSNVSRDVIGGDYNYAMLRYRVELWANKGLDGIYYGGMVAGEANPNLIWNIGATEKHCTDCLKLNGRVYRARTWAKHDTRPRADNLECKGFQCDCSLEETTQSLTPGRPPRLTYATKAMTYTDPRYPDQDLTPPLAVQATARRSLRDKTLNGLSYAYAHHLAHGNPVSMMQVERMAAFFADKATPSDYPAWGGSAGKAWAERVLAHGRED